MLLFFGINVKYIRQHLIQMPVIIGSIVFILVLVGIGLSAVKLYKKKQGL